MTFNNNSDLAFCLNLQSNLKKSTSANILLDNKKSNKPLQSEPYIYHLKDQ